MNNIKINYKGWVLWAVLLLAAMYILMSLFGTGASFGGLVLLILFSGAIEYVYPFRESPVWKWIHN